MNHTLITEYDGFEIKLFIEFENDYKIQIDYKENYEILKDENFIYYFINNEIIKIYDINLRMYINNKSTIEKIYNDYLNEQEILKKEKGLKLIF